MRLSQTYLIVRSIKMKLCSRYISTYICNWSFLWVTFVEMSINLSKRIHHVINDFVKLILSIATHWKKKSHTHTVWWVKLQSFSNVTWLFHLFSRSFFLWLIFISFDFLIKKKHNNFEEMLLAFPYAWFVFMQPFSLTVDSSPLLLRVQQRQWLKIERVS